MPGKISLSCSHINSFVADNMKAEPSWAEDVFERLFVVAVDCESPEMLSELLELAYDQESDHPSTPFLAWHPLPNSRVLAASCIKDNYALVRLLVDRGYRLKPYRMGNSKRGVEEEERDIMARDKLQEVMQIIFQRVKNEEDESFEAGGQIQNLRVMELAVKPSYILACYTSLADKYDWKSPVACECIIGHPSYNKSHSTVSHSSSCVFYLSQKVFDEGFHGCHMHNKFEPGLQFNKLSSFWLIHGLFSGCNCRSHSMEISVTCWANF